MPVLIITVFWYFTEDSTNNENAPKTIEIEMDSEIPLKTVSSKISHETLTVLILKTTWIYSEMVPIHTVLSPGSVAKAQTAAIHYSSSTACHSKNITIRQAEAETHFCHSEMVPHTLLSPDSAAKAQMATIIHHSNSTACCSKNITTIHQTEAETHFRTKLREVVNRNPPFRTTPIPLLRPCPSMHTTSGSMSLLATSSRQYTMSPTCCSRYTYTYKDNTL